MKSVCVCVLLLSLTLNAVDIQGRNRDTLVYTPGFLAMAQPVPQLTTPSRRWRLVLDRQSGATKGPPLSPWSTEEYMYSIQYFFKNHNMWNIHHKHAGGGGGGGQQ